MQPRLLGRTGLSISPIAFGCGPVSALLVGDDVEQQRRVVEHAVSRGVNWFDSAAGYGDGRSETALGRALGELGITDRVHVATKVRLRSEDLNDIGSAVRRSVEQSLRRLRLPSVTLLQLHNSITPRRDDEPTSITPADVLGPRGVAEVFDELRSAGLVRCVGLTGIGNPAALREVVCSGRFDTMQVPYHFLNPSAGRVMSADFAETNFGNIIADCAEMQMGVMAIRVFAAGALLDNPPSVHTHKTPFFPLDLYERDRRRAAELRLQMNGNPSPAHTAVRFALAHPQIHAAIIGFAETWQIDEAVAAADSLAAHTYNLTETESSTAT